MVREFSSYSHNYGGILIEFAFSIPILISLLFFACDHYRIYELKNKLKASAYLAASMVQQLKNTKADKQLTTKDLAIIAYASCLNLFHTNSMFSPHPLGISFTIDYDWVKRINSGSYQRERYWGTTEKNCSSIETLGKGTNGLTTYTQEKVKTLHPDLICDNDGDERLLIQCYYRQESGFNKSKLGLFLLNPKFGTYDFGYKLAIVPKPGLFPAK